MSLKDLNSRSAVLAAIAEYDAIGRRAFLERYGFGPSTRYLLVHNERQYDSKAIAGVAYGFEHPELGPLRSKDFSGGRKTVKRVLEQLGFQVIASSPDLLPKR